MSTPFNMVKDQNGLNAFGRDFNDPTYTYNCTLLQTTATPLTIPVGDVNKTWLAIITYAPGANVWVANNATATGPAGNTFAATASHQLVSPMRVRSGDVLSFYTPNSGGVDVGVQLYALREQ